MKCQTNRLGPAQLAALYLGSPSEAGTVDIGPLVTRREANAATFLSGLDVALLCSDHRTGAGLSKASADATEWQPDRAVALYGPLRLCDYDSRIAPQGHLPLTGDASANATRVAGR